MDPISLAVWYLDDGSKKSDCAACRLATLNICNLETLQGFTLEENMALVECLRSNFGIEATPGGGRGESCTASPSQAGTGVIYPLAGTEIPSMLYKLQ